MSSQNRFGLNSNTIAQIQSVLTKFPLVQRATIYGSRAKGNYKIGSDIDLTLIGDQLTTTDLLKIENALDDLLLPNKIDLSLYHQIENPDLVDHIKRVGIIFFDQAPK